MAQAQPSGLRPSKTSKELANAAYDDFKRKAIDEAKKRAVSQRVDYDTFKNMVLTAHLKPITAPNTRGTDRPLPCWSFGADGKVVKEEGSQLQMSLVAPSEIPKTSGDFYRDWRRNHPTPDDKYRYLKLCGPDTVRTVFRVEVSTEVLRELLGVLEACWLGHGGVAEEAEGGAGAALREAAFVVQLLGALSAAGRFALTVKLLGSSTKPVLERLFAGLESAAKAAAAASQEGEGEAAAEAGSDATPTTAADPDCSCQDPSSSERNTGSTGGEVMCTVAQLAALREVYGLSS